MTKLSKITKRCSRGYMTVEAGFIIPWAFFIMIFLIYAGFYLYDKCVLFQDVYAICFRGSIQKEDNTQAAYVNEHLNEQFGKKYFAVGHVDGKVEQSGKELQAYGTCRVQIPVVHFLTMTGNDSWQIQTSAKAQILNPTNIIRKCRMVENVLDIE